MQYNLDIDDKGLAKGPFFGAAAFIFVILALFASISLQEHGTLGHWQIAACLLGTGLIAILLFLPYFLETILERIENLISNNDSDSIRKAIFELKEIRSELNTLALKTDKVPTLVDKIVSESMQKTSEGFSDSEIIEKLKGLESKIVQKLDQVEQSALSTNLLPEPDLSQKSLNENLEKLFEQVTLLEKKFDLLKESSAPPFTAPPPTEDFVESSNETILEITEEQDPEILDEEDSQNDSENEDDIPDDEASDTELDEIQDNDDPTIKSGQIEEGLEDFVEESATPENSASSDEEPFVSKSDKSGSVITDEPSAPQILGAQKDEDELPQELDLGLPSPEETLRKVDALLAGEEKKEVSPKTEDAQDDSRKNGTTTVVANVMIGIGNKPYLRGDGPGLSWEEGVSMNFVEIGKWAWSPPRKNASLTVQVYRNDQDPDKGGKVEVKPGQKLEITPDFS